MALTACGSSDDKSGAAKPAQSASASSCKPKHQFKTITSGTLKAVLTAYPPYGYVESGEPKGIDGEIIKSFATTECLKLDVSDVDTAAIPAMIKSGRADVSGGDWWRSKDRQKVVAMSDPTYLDGFGVLSKDGLDSVAQLKGKKVGDLQGNIWNSQAKKIFGSDYKLYRTQQQAMQDLKNGRIEVAFSTPGSAAYYVDKSKLTGYQLKVLQPDPEIPASQKAPQGGIMHGLGNPELTKALNDHIAEMKADGTLKEIVERYGLPASVLETGPPYFT
jgi:polar amino acid transport system substrate-binding protein